MLLLMSVRVNQKLKLLPSDLQTPRVSPRILEQQDHLLMCKLDANLFKEAFIKAQQENEALFNKPAAASS